MAKPRMSEPVEILSRRMDLMEQILPTLAREEDLLATKEDLRRTIDEAVAPLATKEELGSLATGLRQEIREEGERSRRHMTVLIEHQEGKIDLLAEHVLSVMPKRPEK